MFGIEAPHGAQIQIPQEESENGTRYPSPKEHAEIRSYYDREGYVVVRRLLEPETCDDMRAAFAAEVKPYEGFIYRQASANPERHVLTPYGYMLNSILNVHAVDPRHFPQFRKLGTELITIAPMRQAIHDIMGEPGKVVQSMYFEGNPATWAHQDSYYLDSERLGAMVGAWIALEDIAPGAGRFFVYPRSHLINLDLNKGAMSIATNHDRYKQQVIDVIRRERLECRAPALRKGDVLFWGGKTIHGSLETRTPDRSRSSVTCHYIPQSTQFLQYQTRVVPLHLSRHNDMLVHTPKDLARRRYRVMLGAETRFPRAFQRLKRAAVWALTR